MSILKRLLGETAVYGISAVVASLSGFFLVPIYTRTFSPSEYGAIAQVNTTTALMSMFIVFGLDNSAAVWFWERPEPQERSRTFSTWLAFMFSASAVVALLAVLLRGPLAQLLLHDRALSSMWLLFGVNVLAVNVAKVGSIWFRMQRSPWRAVMLTVVPPLGMTLFGILFVVKLGYGLPGVIAGQAAGSWLGLIGTLIALRSVISPRAVERARLEPMLKLSAPLVLMTNLNWIMGSALTYFVNFVCSREDAGLYQVAASLANILGMAIFAFDQAWAPFALSIRDDRTARRIYGLGVEAALVLGLVLAFGMASFARPVLLHFTDPRYVAAEQVLSLLALNAAILGVPTMLSVTFARAKKTMPLAKASFAGAVVTVALLPLLLWLLGKEGAALSVVAGTSTVLGVGFFASQKVFRIDVAFTRLAVALGLAALWVAALLATQNHTTQLVAMIAHRALLVLTFAGALGVLYRRPLQQALAEARSAKGDATVSREES